jgi:hypothetical protein
MTWHVPRNARLDRVVVSTATGDVAACARAEFEPSWNRMHGVRTLAAVASLVLLATALVNGGP